VHLILNGLLGIIIGKKAFPAILVGLALQALLFQFGGITTLGVNTLTMALPAVMCYYMFKGFLKIDSSQTVIFLASFASGFLAVFFSGILVGFSLYLTGEAFLPAAKLIIAAHVPVMIIEGALTAACVLFLRKVKPEILEEWHASK
jgi:cobalt/nickel transport system permease protein